VTGCAMSSRLRRSGQVVGLAGVLVSAVAVLSSPAPATAATARAEVSCEVRGFATDPDPKGSNIRSLPRADAPIIGHLPPRFALTPGDLVGAEFEIIGSKGGWLLIRNAEAVVDTQGNGKRVFKGPGWISGGLAGATLGSQALRAEPRRDAAIVASLLDADKGWGPDSFAVTRIHACQGDFVEVTLRSPQIPSEPEKLLRGWSARPCSNQLTTCDRGE